MNKVRERRLQSDYNRLNSLVASHPAKLAVETSRGAPPETYLLVLRGRSIAEGKGKEVVFCKQQHVKIELGAEYPAMPPLVTFLTPIFHPHVWPQNNVACLGPWNVTETLDNLVMRLYSIAVFDPDHLNWKSVANQEAAVWASRNQHLFPLARLSSAEDDVIQGWYESA